MSILFNHACRYEFFDRNPILLVRKSVKRRTAPSVFMPTEIKSFVDGLALRERTLVFLAASTALRRSELFGLQRGDIDFGKGDMNVTRSIVYGVVGPCKTELSQEPLPLHPLLTYTLSQWREQCAYTKPEDWVFASKQCGGRRPYWGQAILRRYIRPVAQRIGFRRDSDGTSSATHTRLCCEVSGTEFKVMQELLRHSSLRSTLDVYTQAGKACGAGCCVGVSFSFRYNRNPRCRNGSEQEFVKPQ
jgi:integrase